MFFLFCLSFFFFFVKNQFESIIKTATSSKYDSILSGAFAGDYFQQGLVHIRSRMLFGIKLYSF